MRRVIAAFLLVCLGMIIPLAGSPVRFCLLDQRVLVPGFSTCGGESLKKVPCCQDCGKEEHEDAPCCFQVDELPDAIAPSAPDVVPPVMVMDLPEPMFTAPAFITLCEPVFVAARPIRGPDTPTARRAVLGIWRL